METQKLAGLWLSDTSTDLRNRARRVESAYTDAGELTRVCGAVAKAYRDAAAVIDKAEWDLRKEKVGE